MVVNAGRVTVIVLALVCIVYGDQDYYCRFGGDHTLCLYKGVGMTCHPRLRGGVPATAQTAILDVHNVFRQRVAEGRETRGCPGPQPPAANMRVMGWSSELAMIAQRWSDQCVFSRDSCRSVAIFQRVGQTVYQQSSATNGTLPPADWPYVISAWYDQVREFSKASACSFVSGRAEDYTQLVWADSHQVGCGYTVYRTREDPDCTLQLYVCNYGPGGNIEGGALYETGRPCTACPQGTRCSSRQYPTLCL